MAHIDVTIHYQDILNIVQMLNIIMGSQESRGVIVFCRNVSHRLASLNNYLLISVNYCESHHYGKHSFWETVYLYYK